MAKRNYAQIVEEQQEDVVDPVTPEDLTDGSAEDIEEEDVKESDVEESEDVEEEDNEEESEEEENPEQKDNSEMTQMRKDMLTMQATLSNLTSMLTKQNKPKPKEVEMPEKDFLADVDVAELTDNPKVLNQLLNRVAKESAQFGAKKALDAVPDQVQKNVTSKMDEYQYVDSFFKRNNDLQPHRKYFGAVMQNILYANPNITRDELFNKTARSVKQALNIKAKKSASRGVVAPSRKAPRVKKQKKDLTPAQKALNYVKSTRVKPNEKQVS